MKLGRGHWRQMLLLHCRQEDVITSHEYVIVTLPECRHEDVIVTLPECKHEYVIVTLPECKHEDVIESR